MAGVTSAGFVIATLDEIKDALRSGVRAVLGDAVNVDDRSRLGQIIATVAEQISVAWEGAESVATAFSPNAATDTLLDNLAALTGTTRLPATKSTVTLTLTGTPTTVVAAGKIASVPTTASKFVTLAGATITALTAWASSTAYVVGNRRTNSGRSYICITAGTSASSGGPTTTASDITDGTVHWRYLGSGAGAVDVAAEASVTGPVQGYAFTITAIDTAVAGWSGVINLLDATPGNNRETDAVLRARRNNALGGQGVSTLPAVRAAILNVAGVTTCTIFENTSDATVDGITPHAFEALVEGGVDADVATAIGNSKPIGIGTVGTTTGSFTDVVGVAHEIKFSRPAEVDLYVKIFFEKDPDAYPSEGDALSAEKIVEIGDQQRVGRDAVGNQIGSWLYPLPDGTAGVGVPGVLKVTSVLVDTVDPPVTSNVVMTPRQKAVYDTSRITVVSTNGTP